MHTFLQDEQRTLWTSQRVRLAGDSMFDIYRAWKAFKEEESNGVM